MASETPSSTCCGICCQECVRALQVQHHSIATFAHGLLVSVMLLHVSSLSPGIGFCLFGIRKVVSFLIFLSLSLIVETAIRNVVYCGSSSVSSLMAQVSQHSPTLGALHPRSCDLTSLTCFFARTFPCCHCSPHTLPAVEGQPIVCAHCLPHYASNDLYHIFSRGLFEESFMCWCDSYGS